MSEQKQEQVQRSASERLSDLENAIISLYPTIDNMARDLLLVKEAIKLLGNKADAIVKASTRGEALNDTNISKIMVENNVNDLATKVENMKFQGILTLAEESTKDSFLVCQEIDDAGVVQNPRMQFQISSRENSSEVQEKLIGRKAGDIVTIEEGKLKINIQEVYAVTIPAIAPEVQEANV